MILFHIFLLTYSSNANECPAPPPCRCGRKNHSTSYIYCSKQSWQHVPKFVNNGVSNLVYDELVLSSNNIQEIKLDSFIQTPFGVRSLDLTNNPIKQIHRRAFVPIGKHLNELRLSGDHQTTPQFDCQFLRKLKALRKLHLYAFTLSEQCEFPDHLNSLSLDKCVFKPDKYSRLFNLEHLRSLKIEFSDLRNVQLPAFPRLEHLSLRGNGLTTASNELALKSLMAPNLRTLDLSTNRLNDVFTLIEHVHSLQTLILKDNEITTNSVRSLFEKHCCLRNLTKLSLDRNSIDGSLDQLSLPGRLKELSIRQNELTSIGSDILFLPPLLNTLDIGLNPLNQTTRELDEDNAMIFSYLEHLDLSGITSLTGEHINRFLEHVRDRLRTLIIANMNLRDLPPNLKDLGQLRTLDISNNAIETVLDLPRRLQTILANNISLLVFDHSSLSDLEVLSLNSNPNLLEPFHPPVSLKTVFIDQYQHCDCSSLKLYKWLQNHTHSTVVCTNPAEFRNWEMAEMSEEQLQCSRMRSSVMGREQRRIQFHIDLKHTSNGRFRTSWTSVNSSTAVSRVTLRRLPFGPLVSSPTLLNHSTEYEFADNSTAFTMKNGSNDTYSQMLLTYQVCLIVRRRASQVENTGHQARLIRLDKYCKNFELKHRPLLPRANPTVKIDEAQFRQTNSRQIVALIAAIYTSLGLLIIITVILLVFLYARNFRRKLSMGPVTFPNLLNSIVDICTDCRITGRSGFDVPDDSCGKYAGGANTSTTEITTNPCCCCKIQLTNCAHLYHEIDKACNTICSNRINPHRHTLDSLTSTNSIGVRSLRLQQSENLQEGLTPLIEKRSWNRNDR